MTAASAVAKILIVFLIAGTIGYINSSFLAGFLAFLIAFLYVQVESEKA
jgi:hypothetical protein